MTASMGPDAPAVHQFQREQVIGVLALARHLIGADQARSVDLNREVPGVGQDHAVAQQRKIGGGQHVPGAGDGDDDVGVRDGDYRAAACRTRPGAPEAWSRG